MPEQAYMVIDERADHSLRVPRPDLSRDLGTPSACNTADCHGDKSVEWSVQYYEQWYGKARKPHYGKVFAAARAGSTTVAPELARLADSGLQSSMVRATTPSSPQAFAIPA